MKTQKTNIAGIENLPLVRNLITRFPLGCACYETIFDERGEIQDYVVVGTNARFEALSGTEREVTVGKRVLETFGPLNARAVEHFIRLGREAYASDEKAGEAHISVFNHVYKVSFFYISDTLLLGIYEDISPQFFRRYYLRSIPHEVIAKSIAERNAVARNQSLLPDQWIREMSRYDIAIPAGAQSPLEIIPKASDFGEPYDAVFRDPLTGLYDRCFAMEALKMYIDRGVLPLSIALGDVNGLNTINETMGYAAGDDVLARVAKVIRANCRADDVVARWDDDAFMLLLPYASREEAQGILARLQNSLHELCANAYDIVTFGYATSDRQPRTAENLVWEAEKWIHRKKLLVDKSQRSSILRLLLVMFHEKSADAQEHSDRMANHCRWLAERLGLSDEMVNDLSLLSMLHDIGKVGIPDAILNKPGPLTPEERRIIERHPEIGYRITQTVSELMQVSAYILAHHERWDGTGYPKGLYGEEIPIASRIIAVVDAYDVMVSGRIYRPARSKAEAVAELRRCAGTQFDPRIVDAYAEFLEGANHGAMDM